MHLCKATIEFLRRFCRKMAAGPLRQKQPRRARARTTSKSKIGLPRSFAVLDEDAALESRLPCYKQHWMLNRREGKRGHFDFGDITKAESLNGVLNLWAFDPFERHITQCYEDSTSKTWGSVVFLTKHLGVKRCSTVHNKAAATSQAGTPERILTALALLANDTPHLGC